MSSIVEILIKLRRCHLQSNNLKKLIFVNKNYPNDPIINCTSPFNSIEFIGRDADFKKELEKRF